MPADERNAADDDAAAQYAVQLTDAGDDAAFLLGGADVFQLLGRQARLTCHADGGCGAGTAFGRFRHYILGHRIPRPAGGAAAHPPGAGLAALVADVDRFQLIFRHGVPPATNSTTTLIISQICNVGK